MLRDRYCRFIAHLTRLQHPGHQLHPVGIHHRHRVDGHLLGKTGTVHAADASTGLNGNGKLLHEFQYHRRRDPLISVKRRRVQYPARTVSDHKGADWSVKRSNSK